MKIKKLLFDFFFFKKYENMNKNWIPKKISKFIFDKFLSNIRYRLKLYFFFRKNPKLKTSYVKQNKKYA